MPVDAIPLKIIVRHRETPIVITAVMRKLDFDAG
jgi:hypothetical protein